MSSKALSEAERVLTICNACRYCEGFCAVFPAMELRRVFSAADLKYLANLCHNCRGCYYACQYAPPHAFDLNVPKALAELRQETYRSFSWPRAMRAMFRSNGLTVSLVSALSVSLVLLFAVLLQGRGVLFGVHTGEGAFYRVVPYAAMVLPMTALAVFVVIGLWKGFCNLWRETGAESGELLDWRAHLQAVRDALRLKYLDGGGHGCNYPDENFSMNRRYLHHAIFYGFMSCLASTTVAFCYDHFLDRAAPYPFWSWPVILGTAGGLALVAGTAGMLYLKLRMDRRPASPTTFGMDVAFTGVLFLTSLTGIALLCLRATPLMGLLLCVHLGLVAALFAAMPYGKFVHAVYRYGALVRNATEQRRSA